MELRSQEVRTLAPENDPLKMGMGWKVEDLSKPQIMVESTFGDSHPGSAHLDQFVKEAVQAVNDNVGKAARYFATDMCDGIAQGHDGNNDSLPHRDASVNLVVGQLIPIIDTAVMMFVNVTHKKLIDETIMTHRMITEAIANHDPIGAKAAMVMHLNFNRSYIKKVYDGEDPDDGTIGMAADVN